MRVRCSFCSAEYETPVTPAALDFVGRCEQCGRTRLEAVEDTEHPAERGAPVTPPRRRLPGDR